MDSTNNPQEAKADRNIFEEAKMEQAAEHKKVIRNARISLFVIGAFQLAYSVIIAFTQEDNFARTVEIIFGVVVAALFAAMGFLSKKKPFIALIVGLCLYVGLIILAAYNDPSTLIKGIYIRILIITWLIRGISKARHLEEINVVNPE